MSKTQDLQADCFQVTSALGVLCSLTALEMLATVYFNNEMRLLAVEVDHVCADGMLATELDSRLAGTKVAPEERLSVGLGAS